MIGAVAGAVAGLLFAPKVVRDKKSNRRQAKDYAEKGKEMVVNDEKEVKKAISNVADKISK